MALLLIQDLEKMLQRKRRMMVKPSVY